MSKAYEQGRKDGAEAVRDELFDRRNEEEQADRALTPEEVESWFAAGQVEPDEGFINAVGASKVAMLFGVREETDEWQKALDEYNEGFRVGARAAVRASDQPAKRVE